MKGYYPDSSKLLTVSNYWFTPVLKPSHYLQYIMLVQSEIDQTKTDIRLMYESPVIKHWQERKRFLQLAKLVHKADMHLRLTHLNTQAVIDTMGNAFQRVLMII
jgi:hypothetical protein